VYSNKVVWARVHQTGGNRAGNRTLTVPREPGRTKDFSLPTGLIGLPPVFSPANRTGSGLGNPGVRNVRRGLFMFVSLFVCRKI
jgi:hypothetical protein